MIPRVYASLVTLCLAVFVSASPMAARQESTDASFDPDAEQYIDFNPEVEYIELYGGESVARRAPGPDGPGGPGGPGPKPKTACKKLAIRKEWRDLTPNNRRSYIQALQCLQTTPSGNSSLPGNFNKWDEFVYSHSNVADGVHGVGQFLPWHRHFGYLFEQGIRNCGYKGPFPYWDWTRDTKDGGLLSQSVIFDPVTGFGGNGLEGTYTFPSDDDGTPFPMMDGQMGGCVQTGPFAGLELHVGPGRRLETHCLCRNWVDFLSEILTTGRVTNLLAQETYDDFWNTMDGMPFKADPRLHDAGHGFMGGDMGSYYTSPNEPLFYMHHANLDRLWWHWQKQNLRDRLHQMGGKAQWFEPYGEATLDTPLPFAGFAEDIVVRDSMDPRVEPYCYTY